MKTAPRRSITSAAAIHDVAKANRTADGICGKSGSEAGMPCCTTFGASSGSALEARTSVTGLAAGPYQAVLASMAKKNAIRHKPRARIVCPNDREAARKTDINQVYHAGAVKTAGRREGPCALTRCWPRSSSMSSRYGRTASLAPSSISIPISGEDNSVLWIVQWRTARIMASVCSSVRETGQEI